MHKGIFVRYQTLGFPQNGGIHEVSQIRDPFWGGFGGYGLGPLFKKICCTLAV